MSTENILQGILSQKIVQTGGVYSAKTDIVNVDNITATGDIRTNGLIDAAGGINMTGTIESNSSITCNNLVSTSATGPHISTTRPSLKISTSLTDGTGTFDLNNNKLISSGGLGRVRMGAELDLAGNKIENTGGAGTIIFGKNIDLVEHRLTEGSIQVSNCKNFGDFEDAINFQSVSRSGTSTGWHPPISNITGKFNIKDNCGTMTIDNTGSPGTSTSVAVSISGITDNSIVIVTPTSNLGSHSGMPITYWVVTTGVAPTESLPTPTGTITINTSSHVSGIKTFNYFIAKYY
jgi:hypothetical protein